MGVIIFDGGSNVVLLFLRKDWVENLPSVSSVRIDKISVEYKVLC